MPSLRDPSLRDPSLRDAARTASSGHRATRTAGFSTRGYANAYAFE
ncbi:hypothetical protein [Nostoc sp.]